VEQRHPLFGPGGLAWARAQLKEAGYEDSNAAHLTRKVYETLIPYGEADYERTVAAMPIIAQLLLGKPLTEEFWSEEKRAARTHTWAPILPRSLIQGDRVRVRVDAYEGSMAAHNGLVGRVAALRGGVVVAYENVRGSGMGMGVRHPVDKLERQVPIRTTKRGVTQ
jgi:hypothetical protein